MHQATRASIAARRSRPCTCNCSGRPGNNANAASTHAPTADTFINCTSCPGFTRHTIDSVKARTSCLGTARRSPLIAPPTPAHANRTPTTEPAPSAHTPAPRTASSAPRRYIVPDVPLPVGPNDNSPAAPTRIAPSPSSTSPRSPDAAEPSSSPILGTSGARANRTPPRPSSNRDNRPQRRIGPRRNFTRPHPIAIAIGIRTKARGVRRCDEVQTDVRGTPECFETRLTDAHGERTCRARLARVRRVALDTGKRDSAGEADHGQRRQQIQQCRPARATEAMPIAAATPDSSIECPPPPRPRTECAVAGGLARRDGELPR